MKKLTYIFDTNVYGEILVEANREQIVQKLKTAKYFFIYGVDVIEKEIDNSPKDIKYKGQFFRNALSSLFKVLVDEVIIKDKRKKYSETDLNNIINKINGLRTPKLVDYFEFRRRHLK